MLESISLILGLGPGVREKMEQHIANSMDTGPHMIKSMQSQMENKVENQPEIRLIEGLIEPLHPKPLKPLYKPSVGILDGPLNPKPLNSGFRVQGLGLNPKPENVSPRRP